MAKTGKTQYPAYAVTGDDGERPETETRQLTYYIWNPQKVKDTPEATGNWLA